MQKAELKFERTRLRMYIGLFVDLLFAIYWGLYSGKFCGAQTSLFPKEDVA